MSDKLKIVQTRLDGNEVSEDQNFYGASIGYPDLKLAPESTHDSPDCRYEQPCMAVFESLLAALE